MAAGNVTDHKYVIDAATRSINFLVTLVSTTLTGANTGITIAGFPASIMTTPSIPSLSSQAVGGWGLIMGAGTGGPGVGFNRTDFAAFPASAGAAYFYVSGRLRI